MTTPIQNPLSEREFLALMQLRGIRVPASYESGTLSVFHEMVAMAASVRVPLDAEIEPASQFDASIMLRGR